MSTECSDRVAHRNAAALRGERFNRDQNVRRVRRRGDSDILGPMRFPVGINNRPHGFFLALALTKNGVTPELNLFREQRLRIPPFDPLPLTFGTEQRESSFCAASQVKASRTADLLRNLFQLHFHKSTLSCRNRK